MKIKHFIITALILVSLSADAGGPVLPEEWRLPTDDETYQKYDQTHLNTLISGDFNGDGLTDGALIAITTDDKKQDLLVFIYDKNLHENWQVLDSMPFSGSVSMGLTKVLPGNTKVLCDTDETCPEGDKKEIEIENDAINYFRPESANSIFVYKNGGFERIWQSD